MLHSTPVRLLAKMIKGSSIGCTTYEAGRSLSCRVVIARRHVSKLPSA
jgi:hypothetical protein